MRVAISGTHCCGKSTLIDVFLESHKDYVHEIEAYEALLELHGEMFLENPSADDYYPVTRDHDGKPVSFEGVPVIDILQMAGVEFGEKLRGKNLALFLVVKASDGYKAVYALPELDPAFNDQSIILADHRDGKPLSEAEDQWRIVVPNENGRQDGFER